MLATEVFCRLHHCTGENAKLYTQMARGSWAPGEAVWTSNSTEEIGRLRPQDWIDSLSRARECRSRRRLHPNNYSGGETLKREGGRRDGGRERGKGERGMEEEGRRGKLKHQSLDYSDQVPDFIAKQNQTTAYTHTDNSVCHHYKKKWNKKLSAGIGHL